MKYVGHGVAGSSRIAILSATVSLLALAPAPAFNHDRSRPQAENDSVQYQYPFQNPDLPIEERVDNVVSLMTLDEKIACLGTDPSVLRINWTQENIPAIVHMTHNSQEEGSALADVLFGDYNPAGRLVQTWPRSLEQLPPMMDYDIRHGRTYMYFKGEPLYPFGYGLSYTTFAYSRLRVSSSRLRGKGSLAVSVDLKNTGNRAGEEVVQMYVKRLKQTGGEKIRELTGFKRVPLQPGETKTVSIPLKGEQLAYWNSQARGFVVAAGPVQVLIGSSSADIKLSKTISITK